MKRLSVCMIVRDEEELLPRCLESLKGMAEEIIIVDTGSEDRTKEISLKYTDQVYDFQWNNDFAAARNESLRYATGKWILVMDADEYLSPNDYANWNNFLDQEKPVSHLAYTLPIINFTGEKDYEDEITTSPVTRLFPNYKGIYFERPIHEQLTRGTQGELFHKKLDLNIYHTGYQTKRVMEKNKHERNMLIFKEMNETSEMSEYDWFTLGNQYRYAKEDEQALVCYEKAIKGISSNLAWYPHCLLGLITLYYKDGKLYKSWKWTEDRLSKYHDYSEYHAIKGIHYETLGFFDEAINSYLQAIKIAERRAQQKQDIWLIDPMYSFDMPVQQLIEIYFRTSNNQQAIYWLSKLLNKNNRNPKMLLKLVEWLKHNESPAAVIQFLNQTYDINHEVDRQILNKVALALGDRELIRVYTSGSLSSLQSSDLARLAIVNLDQALWEKNSLQSFQQKDDNEFYAWMQAVLGGLIWNDPSLLEKISCYIEDSSTSQLNVSLVNYLKTGHVPEPAFLEENADSLFLIGKQLFLLQNYELFDSFVNQFQTKSLINQLANYFYNLNIMDLAMNYYSILLSRQELNFTSIENLVFYHIYHNFMEEAMGFLKAAQQLQPRARHLYCFIIQFSSRYEREHYIEKFRMEFPSFDSISFVNDFLLEQQPR